ncbi:NUDIX domain-containing protein [Acidisoma cellulosilytica]|uniref:NUDIX domain-containing protein n=1 Tax=Acidisoma cellulosilyticum TaxID=2802395 RepID=A0A963YYL7_9PROT|nr:NUDIX domain-containing protein [Acidisoma cellulosilyticum]MCB8879544.1 NUDIX domain-containing protein [Acidisoma cellulosilyticum]
MSLPRVGCGAAILKDGFLLLVQRRRAPEAGSWGLPGGKVDPFERVEDAVAREIAEELGIRIEARHLLCIVNQIDEAAGEHWVAPVYRVDRFEGEPRLMEPEALAGLGWFALDDLPAPLTEATRQALATLRF